VFFIIILLSNCSTFSSKIVDCPNTTSPKGTEEIIAISESGTRVYIGFRGLEFYCTSNGSEIDMDVSINIRSVRKSFTEDDFVPITVSLVSVDTENKEYDRDDFSYSQFLLKGSRTVDRPTKMDVVIPNNGKVYIGIKQN
jgi:hypothetical protein